MKPKILITEPDYFTERSIARMREIGEVTAKRVSREELLKAAPTVNALVVRIETPLDREILEAAKNLQCVISATTGTDHIDVEYLKSRNIPLFSLQGAHSISAGEHAIAMLFSLARRIPWAHKNMIDGGWDRWKFQGIELEGKTLGLLAIGRVGAEVAKRAIGLGMNVIAYDAYVSDEQVKALGAKKVDWNELLRESDVFSLHAPLTPETRNMFGSDAFAKMKTGALIVNTSRGGIIDQEALFRALDENKLWGAAIDVYDEEPLPANHPLREYAKTHENLILTPHIGATTKEAISRASDFTANAIATFFV